MLRGAGPQAWHLAVLLAASTAALFAVDRVARRLLPLATLLELSMLFPDHAPSRVAVARQAIRKRSVEEQLSRVSDAGDDPAAAAREILGLVAALRAHDRPTRGHAERVRMLTDLVAEAMNIPERDRDLLRWAAILHDIGKLRVPPAILNKPGKPTDDEWAVLRAHPMHGAQIAGALLPWLGEWGNVIVEHHERYDGTGYPMGLAGREISLGGRLVAVADAYEVMTAARAYRRPISRLAAHRELVKWSGRQFDPAVVRAMVSLSAPRLRRAQGLIAWVSDIPLVATSYVPAATVARVVGAGALATGAATGVGLPTAVVSTAGPVHVDRGSVSAASAATSDRPTDAGGAGQSADTAAKTSTQADQRAGLERAATAAITHPTNPASDAAAVAGPGPTASADPEPKKTASSNSGSGNSGSGNSGSGNSGSGSSNSDSSNSGKGTSAVGTVTSTVGGTVTGAGTVVKGSVGTVTTTVDDTVGALPDPLSGSGGPVGTVAGTVGTVTGTVTGTVGATVGTVTDTTTGTVTGVLDGVGGLLGGGKKKRD